MNKKLLSVAVVSATVATQATTFIAAEPTVELKDTPIVRKTTNPGVAPIGTVEAGSSAIVKQGKQKVLCLMINLNTQPFQANHNEQFYADSLFGSSPDSVKNFISNQSGGRVVVEPADTKDSAVKGVIKLDVNTADYGTIGASEYALQKKIVTDALTKVKDRVDWAAMDQNNDKKFEESFLTDDATKKEELLVVTVKIVTDALTKVKDRVDWAAMDQNNDKKFEESFLTDDATKKEELLVVTVVSGAAETPNTKTEGQIKIWPHLTELVTQVNEYSFSNSAIVASEKASSNWLNKTILSHEYLHNLNARDMYLDTNSVGPWSTMCDTYGKRPGTQTSSPTPLDPVHKIYMGWSSAKPVTRGAQDVEIPFKKDEVPYIQHPTNPDIVYLLNYIDYSDENVKALNNFGVTGDGMVVWKVNKTEARRDWLKGTGDQNDWYVNSKGPRTAMGVLANGNGDANYTNSFMPVGKSVSLDGTDLTVSVKDKKMILKGTATTPEPPPVVEKLTIEAIDRTIKVGQAFDPLEGIVVRNSKNEIVKAQVSLVKSTVNKDKEGEYTVTVKAVYNGVTAEKTYKVTVEKAEVPVKPPVINAENRVITKGDTFDAKKGVTAVDGEGNDITPSLKVVENGVKTDIPGVYQVTFEVADKNGNKVTKTITVTVQDSAKPDPSLKVVENGVKTDIPGVYQVTFEVADKNGNKVTKTITVTVQDSAKPDPEPNPEPGEQKPDGGDQKPDGGGQKPTPDPAKDSMPPKFEGVKDAVIKIGDKFNPLEGVTAKDEKDGDVKVQVMPTEIDSAKPPKFEGVKDAVIKIGDKFNPLEGVTAKDEKDGDVKVQVMPTEIDSAKPGTFTLTYYAFDKSGNMASYDRTVQVIDGETGGTSDIADKVAPEIKLFDEEFSFPAGNHINPLSFVRASDNTDGDISGKVKIVGEVPDLAKPGDYTVKVPDLAKPGDYTVKVEVSDKAGNKKEASMKFHITDLKAAIYAPETAIHVGDKFDPLKGVTAISKTGADITNKVKVDASEMDTSAPGNYIIEYSVKDYDGTEVKVKREIHVVPKNEVDITLPTIEFAQNAYKKGDKFDKMEGVTTTHAKETTVTGEVNTNATGIYPLVYHVKGASGFDIEVVRKVVVLPQELNSSAPYVFMLDNRVVVGTEFKPKSAALVVDKEDGLLNSKLLVEKSDVDINKVGRYTVKFSVIDSDANATSHVTNVNVVAKPVADPSKPGEAIPTPNDDNKNPDKNQPGGDSDKPDSNGNGTSGNGGRFPQAMGNLPKTGTTVMGFGAAIGAAVSGILRFKPDSNGNGTSGNGGRFPQAMGNLPKTGTTVMGFGAAIGAAVSGILRFGRRRH